VLPDRLQIDTVDDTVDKIWLHSHPPTDRAAVRRALLSILIQVNNKLWFDRPETGCARQAWWTRSLGSVWGGLWQIAISIYGQSSSREMDEYVLDPRPLNLGESCVRADEGIDVRFPSRKLSDWRSTDWIRGQCF
jgi:hypothetical protein